jgi:hypothetical protein
VVLPLLVVLHLLVVLQMVHLQVLVHLVAIQMVFLGVYVILCCLVGGWSGPIARYRATLSGFIGISICPVCGLITPVAGSMVIVQLMMGSCMWRDSANCNVII